MVYCSFSMKSMYVVLGVGIIAIVGGMLFYNETTPANLEEQPMSETKLALWSPVFEHNGTIPARYTCDGERTVNPPLKISNIPEGTKSLALVMDDPDIPEEIKKDRGIEEFDHWAVYSIPPDTTEIGEGAIVGALGMNGRGEEGYTGPCPPPEFEPTEHRYIFKLFALKGSLQFIKAPSKAELLAAMQGMILDEATLIGTYDRSQ